MTKTGLTVGKYAPFHKGHQFLIETALKEVDQLIVVVYDAPKYTAIPLNIRSNWLRKLYPELIVIEGWDVPTDEGWTEEIQQKHENYIISLLDGVKIDFFYSSESYGKRMSQALGCENKVVDMDRNAVSITGTDIRNDAYAYRNFLDPLVYSDTITKVVFLGVPEPYKANFVTALAKKYHTAFVSNVETDYRMLYGKTGSLSEAEFFHVAELQLKLENEKIMDSHKYLFLDSNSFMINISSQFYHKHVNPRIETLIDQFQPYYDLVFLWSPDDSIKKSDYYSDVQFETNFQNRIIADLKMRRTPYFVLEGSLDERFSFVETILKKHTKYMNPMDIQIKHSGK